MEQHELPPDALALLLFSGKWEGRAGSEEPQNVLELQSAVLQTFGKLGPHLSRRLGSGGYQTLLKQAHKLAEVDFPWLAAVQVTENGDLAGFGPVPENRTVAETAEGIVVVLARLIGLLDMFIGRDLCQSILHIVWPDRIRIDPPVFIGRQ